MHDHEPKRRKSTGRNVQNGKAKFRIIVFCMTVFYSSNTNLKEIRNSSDTLYSATEKKKKSRDHEKKTALYRALYWHIFTASLQMTLTWLATLEQCFGVISRMTNGVIQVTEQWNQVLGEKQFRLNLNKESWSGCNNIGESRFQSN